MDWFLYDNDLRLERVKVCLIVFRRLCFKDLIILCNLQMPCKSYAILYMLDATSGVCLWPQVNRCNIYIPGHFFVNKFLEEIFIGIVIFCV